MSRSKYIHNRRAIYYSYCENRELSLEIDARGCRLVKETNVPYQRIEIKNPDVFQLRDSINWLLGDGDG